jgi:hypothetical protein
MLARNKKMIVKGAIQDVDAVSLYLWFFKKAKFADF